MYVKFPHDAMGSSMNRDICVLCLFVFGFAISPCYEKNVRSWREVYQNSTRTYLVGIITYLADSFHTL